MRHNRTPEISVRDLLIAGKCPHAALSTNDARQRAKALRTDERSQARIINDLARRLLTDDPERLSARALDQSVTLVSDEKTNILQKAWEIAQARLGDIRDASDVKIGVRQKWYDSETGWTIVFQPDLVEIFSDDEGEYFRVTGWHFGDYVPLSKKQMARLFGLMHFIKGKGEMAVEMVSKDLLTGRTVWSELLESPEEAIEMLRKVQEILRSLTQYIQSDRVPPRKHGDHCKSCPVNRLCKQGLKYLGGLKSVNATR